MMSRIFVSVVLLLLAASFCLAQDRSRYRPGLPIDNLSSEENALLEEAFKLLDKDEGETGRFLLSAIIAGYGKSDGAKAGRLALADSFYYEGSSESLRTAAELYGQWLALNPNDENSDQILYRLAQTQLRMTTYRDGSPQLSTEKTLDTLLKRFPESPLRPQAEELLYKVQEKLGDGNLAVARFYRDNRGAMDGAEDRLKVILEKYKHYSKTDEVLFLLGKTEQAREDFEESGKFLRLLIEKYPNSRNAPAACELLGSYGEIVPDKCQ